MLTLITYIDSKIDFKFEITPLSHEISAAPRPPAGSSNNKIRHKMESNEIEVTGLLYEGIVMELEMWDALNTALSQKWGKSEAAPIPAPPKEKSKELIFTGTDDQIRDKMAIYFADTMGNFEISKDDLKDDLAEIMLVNFGLAVEDDSDSEVRLAKRHNQNIDCDTLGDIV